MHLSFGPKLQLVLHSWYTQHLNLTVHAGPHYRIIVRLIPPCLIACFLIGLFAWFGVDLQQETEGLSTTQKVASIGSASFTLMTIVALFVRAAMCTGEWQWLLQMCDRLTGWDLLQQKQQQQQPAARDMLPVFTAAPALPIQAIGIPEKCLDSGCNHHNQTVSIPSSPDSMNSSTIEEWKKQS